MLGNETRLHFLKNIFYDMYNKLESIKLIADNNLNIDKFLKENEIIIFEWMNISCLNFLNKWKDKLKNKVVIVRCHDYEVTSESSINTLHRINYNLIDYIWFINNSVRNKFHSKVNFQEKNTFVIPNRLYNLK